MKNISIAARISEKTAIDKKDIKFIKEKLNKMTQGDFIRMCINTQRRLEAGELVKTETLDRSLDKFKKQLIQVLNEKNIDINRKNKDISKHNKDSDNNSNNIVKEKSETEEDNKDWEKNEDFLELLKDVNVDD